MGSIGAATRSTGPSVRDDHRVQQSPSAVAPELVQRAGCRARIELDELLATSDVVSLHCPYSTETHHLIGAAQLSPDEAAPRYLVNTARGPIVDEAALGRRAERPATIAGAGLDVFEQEPEVHAGLLDLDNVVLIPHLGSATIETRTAMATLAADNTLAVLRGQDPLTPVR